MAVGLVYEEARKRQKARETQRKLDAARKRGASDQEVEDIGLIEEHKASSDPTTDARGSVASSPSSSVPNVLGGVWGALLLGLAILLVNEMIGTNVGPGLFLAVFVYVVFASLVPIVGVPIGIVIVVALIVRNPMKFVGKLNSVTGYSGKAA